MPFYKQPILHFLFIGALLFYVYGLLNPNAGDDDRTIVVDDATLLEFVQYRNKAFNPVQAQAMINHLTQTEQKYLVEQLVREEALYREALKIGFDRNDYVIKRRLIQKMEYLSQGYQPEAQDLAQEVVERYFNDNRDRYFEPASITFTHVFVDKRRRELDSAKQMANNLLHTLQTRHVTFSDAMGYGDRFIYYTNYVERSQELVASHFGKDFADKVFDLDVDNDWHGPIESAQGLHLVLVAQKTAGGIPPLETIYAKVAQDARQALLEKQKELAIDQIIACYQVDERLREPGPESAPVAFREPNR